MPVEVLAFVQMVSKMKFRPARVKELKARTNDMSMTPSEIVTTDVSNHSNKRYVIVVLHMSMI